MSELFLDASALVAVLGEEEGSALFIRALERSRRSIATEFVVLESGLALMRIWRSSADATHARIAAFLNEARVTMTPLTSPMILMAMQVAVLYGKGRKHPAQLNMGDCLSYAAARTLGLPLLYKGEDFAQTDILSALA